MNVKDMDGCALAPARRTWVEIIPIALRRALAPFLLSRFAIAMLLALAPALASRPVDAWNRDDGTALRLSAPALRDGVARVAIANDAAWYFSIARDGYDERPFDTTRQANWAFFPLHPLLWRAAAAITGEWVWSGIAMANMLFLMALCMLWHLVREHTEQDAVADTAVLFACIWPSSYFMSLPHTEAIFLLLVATSLLASALRAFGVAGIATALASATRFNGLFLVPSLGLAWWRGDRRAADLVWLAVAATGTAAFAIYLWRATGNPFAFKDIQAAWGRHVTTPWAAIVDYAGHPAKVAVAWNPRLLHFMSTMLGIASIVTCWRRGWHQIAIFTGLTLLAPLATGTLTSITRYLGVAPGLYIALAMWAHERPRLGQALLVACSMCLALMCALFAAGFNMASA
ncbi:hypothetical protein [Luteibacter yeojuensis]|uniref:Mannosyltransferase PIG-V n=1 Tax=Luteibacter yeojuensis TaxID=345309 RepID=A0A0F3KKD5_9GAMM|nr:hypothetical protein [Luteibacter yeojuensis]KJV31668.1 hypothetical protein VI08_13480 [Luteibacter yeojuensis]